MRRVAARRSVTVTHTLQEDTVMPLLVPLRRCGGLGALLWFTLVSTALAQHASAAPEGASAAAAQTAGHGSAARADRTAALGRVIALDLSNVSLGAALAEIDRRAGLD